MSQKILWSIVLVVVLIVSVFTVITYMDTDDAEPQTAENEEKEKKPEGKQDKQQVTNNEIDPFNQKYKQEELTDTHFRDYIHKMSHQKVAAEDKWGFYEITDERMAWLLSALETDDVKRRLTDADIYFDILNRWQHDDFSQVDKDHNAIWRLQGGTVGKAIDILDEEAEEAYIERTAESE